jgi:Fe-S-cluster containining protein
MNKQRLGSTTYLKIPRFKYLRPVLTNSLFSFPTLKMKQSPLETEDYLGKTLQAKIYQSVVVQLLKADKTFSPGFLNSIKRLYSKGEEVKAELLESLDESRKKDTRTDCKKGCSYCCGLTVKVAVPELYLILEHLLDTLSSAELSELKTNLRKNIQLKQCRHNRNERIMVKCTFLKNNSCSIYEYRPFSCRAWNSSDANICFEFLNNADLDIPVSIYHYAPFDIIRKAIDKALYVVGVNDTNEELNAGILRLLEGECGK